jgi:ribonuclease P protein component
MRTDSKKNNLYTANVAKKSVKLSVNRNMYKRWMRACYHKHKAKLAGFDTLIMPRRSMPQLQSFADMDGKLAVLFEGAVRKALK